MIANAAKAFIRTLRRVITRQPVIVSERKQAERLDICHKCEKYSEGQCQECLCWCELKALFYIESCPLNKW